MPNGRPYDNPVTDTVVHGMHPFPPKLERLVVELNACNPGIFNDLEWAPFDWEKGKFIAEATVLLQGLLEHHGDPTSYPQLIAAYRRATRKSV